MLQDIKLENILFLDIETVPVYNEFAEMPENYKVLWDKKSRFFRKEGETAESVYNRAGIYAEFGKIICISIGIIYLKEDIKKLRLKSFYGDDEFILLTEFINLLNTSFFGEKYHLCAHNGREFDFPYISRRCLINHIRLPKILNIAGKKPWEIRHLDTLELWKFGDYKHYTSLNLLTTIFNIPTSKDDIEGSDVARVYYTDKDIPRIVRYCEKDVIAVVQLILNYIGEPIISEENIESITTYLLDE